MRFSIVRVPFVGLRSGFVSRLRRGFGRRNQPRRLSLFVLCSTGRFGLRKRGNSSLLLLCFVGVSRCRKTARFPRFVLASFTVRSRFVASILRASTSVLAVPSCTVLRCCRSRPPRSKEITPNVSQRQGLRRIITITAANVRKGPFSGAKVVIYRYNHENPSNRLILAFPEASARFRFVCVSIRRPNPCFSPFVRSPQRRPCWSVVCPRTRSG